jgi:predicted short-subunit dehydrogenase-like oxidoreductase (DUF2520 family)
MKQRLLIWGFGRVGKAIVSRLLSSNELNESTKIETTVAGEGHSIKPMQLSVISSQQKPMGLDSVSWIDGALVKKSPSKYILPNDIVLACVSDSYIPDLAKLCDLRDVVFLHCSGATPMSQQISGASGVFYPLQSFHDEKQIVWTEIPVFFEYSHETVLHDLQWLANQLNVGPCNELSLYQRQYLHLTAVFANNYTTAMAGIAHDLLESRGLSPSWILPILKLTASNVSSKNPWETLTGPAKRGDMHTIQSHLDLLSQQSELQRIYESMNEYIRMKHTVNPDAPDQA